MCNTGKDSACEGADKSHQVKNLASHHTCSCIQVQHNSIPLGSSGGVWVQFRGLAEAQNGDPEPVLGGGAVT